MSEADAEAQDEPDPQALVDGLVRLLDVELIDTDLYRGARRPGGQGRVFGGQVIAQALASAARSVESEAVAHSLHAYFMRPGDEALPIVYRVERDFEGKSFATRRVIALQRGRPILNLAASFHRPEGGFAHQDDMPDAPSPEGLPTLAELIHAETARDPARAGAELARRPRREAIELRPVAPGPLTAPAPGPPHAMTWFRTAAPVGDDPHVHRSILAYASDMMLLGTSMRPHGVTWTSPGMQTASLDHALWIHDDLRVDGWLLYVTDSPWAGRGRGFNRGRIFSPDGRLVADVAQEGLIRRRAD